jgi:hypothetical protein
MNRYLAFISVVCSTVPDCNTTSSTLDDVIAGKCHCEDGSFSSVATDGTSVSGNQVLISACNSTTYTGVCFVSGPLTSVWFCTDNDTSPSFLSILSCSTGYVSLSNASWSSVDDPTTMPTCDDYKDYELGGGFGQWDGVLPMNGSPLSYPNYTGLVSYGSANNSLYLWYGGYAESTQYPCAAASGFNASADTYCSDCSSGQASPAGFGHCIECSQYSATASDDKTDCICNNGVDFDWDSFSTACIVPSSPASLSVQSRTSALAVILASWLLVAQF